MTNDQITFRKYLLHIFVDQRHDIISSLVWISNHYYRLPYHFQSAYRALSVDERNAVIREVLMNGD
ncbi:hypothetical protein [Levilactobacillus andaensis]|uniref:hypothetical protein n=1 Tax=Levilactobacillus andaensis TaxID=2799570 RepID=UPI0019403CCD|nr:hypothetical protein [Levilactobacillus andaensis]